LNIQAPDFHGLQKTSEAAVDAIIAMYVAARPESPAIVMSRNDVLTYRTLGAQIAAYGAVLHAKGIGRSGRVAVMLPNGVDLAVALVATACHAVAVPLNPKLTVPELDNMFVRLCVDAIIISKDVVSTVRDLAIRHGICRLKSFNIGPGRFEILTRPAVNSPTEQRTRNGRPDDIAFILCTSATTGRPKLVPITHRSLVVKAERRRLWFDLTPEDRGLFFKPLYYAAGLRALLETLLLGGSVALPDSKAGGDIIDWLVDLQPTWYHGGQTAFIDVLERLRTRQGKRLPHRLRFIRAGGAPLSATVRRQIEEAFSVPVLEAYGLSEASFVATNFLDPVHRKSGTVGRPWPNEIAIRGEDGHLLPPGAVGEIIVRGPSVMPGYLDDDEANRTAFVDGWFRTGDLGSIDAEGFLTVLGRLKELINRGGEKISPYEIERALLLHPSVREAVAFSLPHPRLGEVVAAAVVLVPGVQTTSTEIKSFLLQHLAPFKIPQHLFVKTELPKGATGKALRRQLAEEAIHRTAKVAPPETLLQVQILDVWQKLIGRDDIGIDDDFFEVGGDSLLATQMLCELEANTRQKIPLSELRAAFTVRELEAIVLRDCPATVDFVTCVKEGQGTPFLFCHGDYQSRGFYALRLAAMLTCDAPVFLLHPYPNPDPKLTVEEMAQAYLSRILAVHPTGAFRLGGFCNATPLTWEIASQLNRLGREVEFVVLIEPASLNARRVLRAAARLIRFIGAIAPKKISEKFERDGMSSIWSRGWHRYPSTPYSHAARKYIPPKLQSPLFCVFSEEKRGKAEYSTTPWKNVAPKVHCKYIAATHFGCITTHLGDLARVLDGLLKAPRAATKVS
jgi:acyl-CoA synthetase (AMP-forming)/AMP-acid ligase II